MRIYEYAGTYAHEVDYKVLCNELPGCWELVYFLNGDPRRVDSVPKSRCPTVEDMDNRMIRHMKQVNHLIKFPNSGRIVI